MFGILKADSDIKDSESEMKPFINDLDILLCVLSIKTCTYIMESLFGFFFFFTSRVKTV